LGNGSEIIVGLAPLGTSCVIFTNERIHVFDPESESIRTVPSSVGCISRDAITPTERGIRFVATDGIPRLFNGALVEEVADELLPIFDRDDYQGAYLPFDKSNGQEIVGTYGDRKFFMVYPVSAAGNLFKPGQDIASGIDRDLAVGASRVARRFGQWTEALATRRSCGSGVSRDFSSSTTRDTSTSSKRGSCMRCRREQTTSPRTSRSALGGSRRAA
jgi:hypothetical protein